MKKLVSTKSPKAGQQPVRFGVERQRPTPTTRLSKLTTQVRNHTNRFEFRTTSTSSIEQCNQQKHPAHNMLEKQYSFEDRTHRKAETLDTREDQPFRASYSRLSKLKRTEHRPNELKQQITQPSNELSEILQLIHEQKQAITAKINRTNLKAENYKRLYHQTERVLERQRLEKQHQQSPAVKLSEESKEIYSKFGVILQQMNIEPSRVLPEDVLEHITIEEPTGKECRVIGDPEVIRVQKFLIRKLVERLEQERRSK